jgi:MtN3 and saliva related transmembrane protein
MYLLKDDSHVRLLALRVFEPLMVATGIVTPIATLPSILKLYLTHSQYASGLSLITWSLYSASSFLWLLYGLLNRKPPIFIGNGLGLVTNLLMVNGILTHAGWTY